jgi:HAD superfamily hydrolase (TIGR01509 family)
MIKAVIFDVGGVILEAGQLEMPVLRLFRPENKEEFWQDLNVKFSPLCRGEGTLLDFWKNLAKDHGKDIPEKELKRLWTDEFKDNLIIDKEVSELIAKLKKNYRLAIISNAIGEHTKMLADNPQFVKLRESFDLVIFSNEVKMAKDNKDIFLYTLGKLKLKPAECVFTDDTKQFVDVARSVGINAIQFKNIVEFKKYLVGFGVKI